MIIRDACDAFTPNFPRARARGLYGSMRHMRHAPANPGAPNAVTVKTVSVAVPYDGPLAHLARVRAELEALERTIAAELEQVRAARLAERHAS